MVKGLVVAALALGLVDQVLLRTVLADGELLGRKVAPFDPPLFSPSQVESLARIRRHVETGDPPAESFRFDPELGWCPRPDSGHGEFRYDWAGCRIGVAPLSRELDSSQRRVVTIGCSMTHGEEVGALETWSAQIDAELDGVEVANLGVAAYGIDQALLRLRRDAADLAPYEVWLGFFPAAAGRVTTGYRPLIRHWSIDVAFKPRFSLTETGLSLRPNPVHSLEHVVRLFDSQSDFLAALGEDEPWIRRARSAYAPRGSHLLHHSFLGRVGATLLEAGGRDQRPWFQKRDHEHGRLLSAIVRETARAADELGAGFLLLALPDARDLDSARANGRGYWADWLDNLGDEGLRTLDLSSALLAAEASTELFAQNGHYSAAGNRVVAQGILDHLRAEAQGH